ncbi:M23 family metallopeptidase [Microbacterium oleivorans]|uniref:M23 family metallopeptidase n=1 Tax=Microbacterium oleivorans TaxID=273677 RepID=UPI00342D67B2
MVQLGSPAPYASETPGLAFGNTTVPPYSKSRPHGGKDHKWSRANVAKSKQVHASAAGVVRKAYNNGAYRDGWGNYVDLHITTEAFTRLAHHATGSVRVRVNQVLALMDRIGTMGDTGEVKPDHDHLHEELWLKQKDGSWKRVNPDLYRGPNGRHLPGRPLVAEQLGDDQRRTTKRTSRRIGEPTTRARTGTPLAKGIVGNFVGFIRGESIGGNNVWFKGISGDYFHSASFEGSYRGLPDLGTWKAPVEPTPDTATPTTPKPIPVPAPIEGDEDMMKPTVHFRTDGGGYDMTVAHPEIGAHLVPFTGKNAEAKGVRETVAGPTKGRVVNTYRGFMATNDPVVGGAWARLYAGGAGKETSRTTKANYEAIQVEAARLATAIANGE